MDEKHTSGPWGISSESATIIKAFDAFGETSVIIGSASGYTGSPYFPNDETAEANARLMAAAPQLLDALRIADKFWGSLTSDDCPDSAHIAIRNAIAAAGAA